MKQLIDLLHTLLCESKHESDMMKIMDRHKDCCYFYLENDVAGGDTMPDHLKWYEVFKKFKESLDLASDQEAADFLRQSLEVSQKVRNLTGGNQARVSFIRTLLP